MLHFAPEAEGVVDHLKGFDALPFGNHTAGADLAGGDHLDVDLCVSEGTALIRAIAIPSSKLAPDH